MPEGNKSLPYGVMAVVRAGFRRLGLYDFFDSLKERGVPLGFVIELMCIDHLSGGRSMNECASRVDSKLVRDELCHGHVIKRKTMERALGLLDQWFEETIAHLWTELNRIYPDLDHDAYVDGSHIPRNGGGKGAFTAAGEGGGTIQLQDQFMVAQLVGSGLPISVEMYDGNLNDPPQYADFIPQLMFMLKKGSMIIMDNGGASKDILDDIRREGNRYLTRKRLNASDRERIRDEIADAVYIGNWTMCIMHEFESSSRTIYLYFSVDRYILGSYAADRRAHRLAAQLKEAKDALKDPKPERFVSVKKNPFYEVKSVKCEVSMTLNPWLEEDIAKAISETTDEDCGWFKLECSNPLPPEEALDKYRHRTAVESLISSIKSIVNLQPLRVWSKSSTRGALLLALIAQLTVSMVRYDLEPSIERKKIDGRWVDADVKPSIDTICRNLIHWTVVLIPREGYGVDRIFTDENDLTRRINAIIERYRGCFSLISRVFQTRQGPGIHISSLLSNGFEIQKISEVWLWPLDSRFRPRKYRSGDT